MEMSDVQMGRSYYWVWKNIRDKDAGIIKGKCISKFAGNLLGIKTKKGETLIVELGDVYLTRPLAQLATKKAKINFLIHL